MSKRRNWLFCIIMGLLAYALTFLPDPVILTSAEVPREQVIIRSVDNTVSDPIGIVFTGVQQAQVEVSSGPHKGKIIPASNYLNGALDKDKLFKEGDRAIAMVHDSSRGLSATLVDHDRRGMEALLLGLYALLLVVFAGVSGVGALVSMVATAVIIWKVYIPLLILGYSPVWTALLLVLLLTMMIDLLVAGPNRMALAAMIGSAGGTFITILLAVIFIHLFKLDGGGLPYIVPLLSQSGMTFDMNQLFLSTVFIANSGAVMDLAMDIAAASSEVKLHAPGISRMELLKAGFSVGRTVIGTMTTTLVLAYAGSYLSMLVYFQAQGTPLIDILNYRFVASEIMVTLVGCFGLVSVAPLTALASSWLLSSKASYKQAEDIIFPDRDEAVTDPHEA